jgi:hypothetical protein
LIICYSSIHTVISGGGGAVSGGGRAGAGSGDWHRGEEGSVYAAARGPGPTHHVKVQGSSCSSQRSSKEQRDATAQGTVSYFSMLLYARTRKHKSARQASSQALPLSLEIVDATSSSSRPPRRACTQPSKWQVRSYRLP